MPAVNKICRVCGKEYEACKTPRPTDNTFRWQDVACSKECGAEYLRSVMIARGLITEEKPNETDALSNKEQATSEAEKPVVTAKRTRKKKSVAASVTVESED